mmetsp:Transcript_9646/g.22028  ORF Transcript_9646/g.22028 Transcript_9646/m.22028 type:complete len:243 (-) Transcript_9646:75-803(-)
MELPALGCLPREPRSGQSVVRVRQILARHQGQRRQISPRSCPAGRKQERCEVPGRSYRHRGGSRRQQRRRRRRTPQTEIDGPRHARIAQRFIVLHGTNTPKSPFLLDAVVCFGRGVVATVVCVCVCVGVVFAGCCVRRTVWRPRRQTRSCLCPLQSNTCGVEWTGGRNTCGVVGAGGALLCVSESCGGAAPVARHRVFLVSCLGMRRERKKTGNCVFRETQTDTRKKVICDTEGSTTCVSTL